MKRAEQSGVLASYPSEDHRNDARKALISSHWGDSETVLRISDALASALERVTDAKPLRTWSATSATNNLVSVHEGSDAVYLILMTRPMGKFVALDKLFDRSFKQELLTQAEQLEEFTSLFQV